MANLKQISFQLQDQHSSSTESTSLSHHEFAAMGKTSSQDQCASSDSVHEESYGKHGQDMKAALYMCNTELSINASQTEISQPIVQFPYAYTDPYFSGLFTAYGPQNMIQPQVMAAASGRVPLPADLPEDGPIYVNAKQYHGILRRRQTRAKLEAQNKLVKTRKPYLHESRHQHALNRVRGSGGRFLSKKNLHQQQTDSGHPPSSSEDTPQDSFNFNQKINMLSPNEHRITTDNAVGVRVSNADVAVHPSHHMAVPMQNNGGFVYNGNRHYASIVR